ncbi:acyl-CoA/acyl-ACP dehydrogenase [Dehalococcoidia bacterium]|nr:acyl-CoA/acyl-ACP dehydrogenase [Dehalococcoidia bacterium]
MDLSLTTQQQLLKNSAQEFVHRDCHKELLLELDRNAFGYHDELWVKIANMGWPGVLIPQRYGGTGGSLTDAAVILEELGKGPVPGPLFSAAVLGALTVMESGTEDQKNRILSNVASGRQILAMAITEPEYGWDPELVRMTARVSGSKYILNGTKLFIPDALAATHLICATQSGDTKGISLLVVDKRSHGISVRPLKGFTTDVTEVIFDSVEVPQSALLGQPSCDAWPALAQAIQSAIPVLCAYQVGACQAVFDMSVEYSRIRMQFGTPIGRFQRVQDHIINIVNHLDAARWTTYESLWRLESGQAAAASVHTAKAVTSEALYKACNYAHEVHAGVGIVQSYGLTLYTKLSRTLYHFLGDPRYHKRRLASILDL